jgi:hypothetical protein
MNRTEQQQWTPIDGLDAQLVCLSMMQPTV